MNKRDLSTKQMINVELATRLYNTKAKKMFKAHTPKEVQADLKIDFRCECSDPDCQERIFLTLNEYEKLHNSKARFVLAKGHEEPLVEKIHKKIGKYNVVEKEALKD
jgi:hypothetical protein